MASYVEKIARLQAEIAAAPAGSSPRVGLAKSTSNLFRDRARRSAPRIDLKHFNRVVAFDPAAQSVDTEGMTTYAELAAATLAQGAMPCVVPQLRCDGWHRHRSDLVSARPGARYGARAGGADRRRPRRHLPAGQRAQ
jgi:FAD/FMN-containing dehydrogenase